MGGIDEVETDKWMPWTGSGEPLPGWTGLKDPNVNAEPKWYRPVSVSSAAKSQHYRVEGLDVKFNRDDDLMTFQRRIDEKLHDHGLKTVAYLPSPADPNKMLNVITHHGWFNDLDQAVDDANELAKDKFDKYDKSNSIIVKTENTCSSALFRTI